MIFDKQMLDSGRFYRCKSKISRGFWVGGTWSKLMIDVLGSTGSIEIKEFDVNNINGNNFHIVIDVIWKDVAGISDNL